MRERGKSNVEPALAEPIASAAPGTTVDAAGAAALARMTQAHDGSHTKTASSTVARPEPPRAGDGAFLTYPLHGTYEGVTHTFENVAVDVVSVDKGVATVSKDGVQLTVPVRSLHREPLLAPLPGGPQGSTLGDAYTQFRAPLWNGHPKLADLDQGMVGDCYLLAAAGALVAHNPSLIESLFSPTTPGASQYSITLYQKDKSGAFAPHTEVVDAFLPTASDTKMLAYDGIGRTPADHTDALWPALLEKAYAQMKGGYGAIGGGNAAFAFEALTGKKAAWGDFSGVNDAGLAISMRDLQGPHAMTAISKESLHETRRGFVQTGTNQFRLTMEGARIKPGSAMVSASDMRSTVERVEDRVRSIASAHHVDTGPAEAFDDGHGQLHGSHVAGTIDYTRGIVDVTYDASVTGVEGQGLTLSLENNGFFEGNVVADHAYVFEGMTPDGLIHLFNPWGHDQPAPLTADQFLRLFQGVSIADSHGSTTAEKP